MTHLRGYKRLTLRILPTGWVAYPRETGVIVRYGASYAIDWIFVRDYMDPEPMISVGTETLSQSQPTPIPEFPAIVIPAMIAMGAVILMRGYNN